MKISTLKDICAYLEEQGHGDDDVAADHDIIYFGDNTEYLMRPENEHSQMELEDLGCTRQDEYVVAYV